MPQRQLISTVGPVSSMAPLMLAPSSTRAVAPQFRTPGSNPMGCRRTALLITLTTDSDRLNNWQEWVSGTDPTNAVSALKLTSIERSRNDVTLTWQSAPGINYLVQRASTLGSNSEFETIATNLFSQSGTNTTFIDRNAANDSIFFYRIGVTAHSAVSHQFSSPQ
jgi:hypothetical protein